MTRGPRTDDEGVFSVEVVTVAPLLVVVALLLWQALLVGTAVTGAENAARSASRALGRGASMDQAVEVARDSGPGWAHDRMDVVRRSDGAVEVEIRTPLISPAASLDLLTVSRSAQLPPTVAASAAPNTTRPTVTTSRTSQTDGGR